MSPELNSSRATLVCTGSKRAHLITNDRLAARHTHSGRASVVKGGNSLAALEYLKSSHPLITVLVFKDFAPRCKDARIHRHLRDLIIASETNGNSIILIDSHSLPEELRISSRHDEIRWPSTAELDDAVKQTFRRVKRQSQGEITLRLPKRDHEQLLHTRCGLTISQAEKVVALRSTRTAF